MRNAGLEEAQAGIKIAGRNINNFRYADDIQMVNRYVKMSSVSLIMVRKQQLELDMEQQTGSK